MSTKPVKYSVKAFASTKDGRVLDSVVMMPLAEDRATAVTFHDWLQSPNGADMKNAIHFMFFNVHSRADQVAFMIVETTLY